MFDGEREQCFDGDVGGEEEKAEGDQLLRASFRCCGERAGAGEAPRRR